MRRCNDASRPNIGVIFNDDTPWPAQMGHDDCADPDLHIVANLDALRVVVFQINFVTDENVRSDLDPSPTVQEHPQITPGDKSRQQVQRPIQALS